MNKKYVFLAVYGVAFAIGVVVTVLASAQFTAYTAGKILGIWSLTALTFQLLLVTRADVIESAIGYDRITRWHALNGTLILSLVLLHPLLLFSWELLALEFGAIITFVLNTPTTWLGEFAVLLILVQIVTTLYGKDLDYERWRIIHRIGYVVVVLGFVHSFLIGTDTAVPPDNLFSVWWMALAAVSAGSVLYRYGYRPVRKKRRFRVTDVREEADDVYTVELQPEETDLVHEPGQFAFVTFESDTVPGEEHHFTIASAPEQGGFAYTIKAVGDFTEQIKHLEEDDTAVVEGPYGAFTMDDPVEPVVLVAGGIGITPFMSMLRHMDNTDGLETQLLYGNRTVDDIAFEDELNALEERNDWLTVTHVLSDEDADGYNYGFIDEDLLSETDTGGTYYICGPPPMMNAVADALKQLGVTADQIHTERFSLRDVNWRRLLPI